MPAARSAANFGHSPSHRYAQAHSQDGRLRSLVGDLAGFQSVSVNGNRRMTFAFANCDAMLVDYQDYH